MDSPLRNPKGVAVLAVLAVAFLAWRLAPLVGGKASPEAISPSPEIASPAVAPAPVEPAPSVGDATPALPVAVARWGDSLGGWDVSGVRDPFQRPVRRIPSGSTRRRHPASGVAAQAQTRSTELRGVAMGSSNLVISQGRVLVEGDSLAGGVLRIIRPDRVVVHRPSGDTELFLPRRFQP